MKFSRRSLLGIVCLFAIAATIGFGSSSPAWGLANEEEGGDELELAEFDELASEGEEEDDFEDDEFDREQEFEYEEDEFHDFDWEEELEAEVLERKALNARVVQLVEISADESSTAAYVLEGLIEIVEAEDAVRLLLEAASSTQRPVLQRMIRIKLIELYYDLEQPEEALEIVRDLISGS